MSDGTGGQGKVGYIRKVGAAETAGPPTDAQPDHAILLAVFLHWAKSMDWNARCPKRSAKFRCRGQGRGIPWLQPSMAIHRQPVKDTYGQPGTDKSRCGAATQLTPVPRHVCLHRLCSAGPVHYPPFSLFSLFLPCFRPVPSRYFHHGAWRP